MLVACFIVLPVAEVGAQQINQRDVQTSGICSPVTGQVGGNLTITCSGISPAETRQIADILNKISGSQIDPKILMGKIDEALNQLKSMNAANQERD